MKVCFLAKKNKEINRQSAAIKINWLLAYPTITQSILNSGLKGQQ